MLDVILGEDIYNVAVVVNRYFGGVLLGTGAVSYTHLKEQVHSVRDHIPGIGETRRKALMRRFRSVENIRDASVEELSQAESMNVQSAEAVYQFFHRAPNHTNA